VSEVTLLRSRTHPRWTELALADLDRTLCDHAHCEKKACATALKLIADHPHEPYLVRPLARLAQEEQQHFLEVVSEITRRGIALQADPGDAYARALVRLVRPGTPRLLDRLLVSALIEARSAERLGLLGDALPEGRLRDLYQRLARSEAGHEQLFVELASRHAGKARVDERLVVLAEAEEAVVAALPLGARIH